MSDPSTDERQATLSREVGELLIELSIGVHRYAMYPPDHPSLGPVTESIADRLAELFQDRDSLSIGVAHRQLVIDGVATDRKHPVLSDLARRLHEHQLGAVRFQRGIRPEEVGGLLGALAADPGGEADPLGLTPRDQIPRWDHAGVHPVGYDALELRAGGADGEGGDRASSLWLGLARAALARDDVESGEVPEGRELARAIREKARDEAYDEVIAGYLRQLARELRAARGGEAEAVRRRVSALVNQLDERTLGRLVRMGFDASSGRTFLLDASHSLAVDSVLRILRAAADSSGQTISHSMTRLLSKLARHAEEDSGALRNRADGALREHVERLLEGWELADPNPDAYTGVLDAMARASPLLAAHAEEAADALGGAERILKTALEVDAWGPTVERALATALETEEGTRTVLALVREPPEGSGVAERIREHLTDPDEFRSLLAGNRVDDEGLRAILDRMGDDAVDPLLDVLANTDHRAVRRKVFDGLLSMGPVVGERALERLDGDDRRWFVLRNMLALLVRLDHVPERFDPQPFLEHEDIRVRREALPLAFRVPDRRERALVTALSDDDERMVRMALLQMADGVPEAVLPTLVNRVALATDRSQEIRTLAVRALAGTRATLARSALLELALSGRTLFGKPRLGSGPEAVAALRVLASAWSTDPAVLPVLEEAVRSKESGIRNAVLEAAG